MKGHKSGGQPQGCVSVTLQGCDRLSGSDIVSGPGLVFYCVAAGFDLMAYFNVREILGTREDDGQSSYVRLGTVPIVQQTE